MPLVPKIQVSLGGGVSRYLLSGFAILLGLFIKAIGLGAKFNSASNGAIFNGGHRTKSTTSTENTSFLRVSKYLLSRFATLLGLFLKSLGFSAEFNSTSNGAIFSRGHLTKSATCAQNTGFPGGRSFKVFAVRIRHTTWVIYKSNWVRCRI